MRKIAQAGVKEHTLLRILTNFQKNLSRGFSGLIELLKKITKIVIKFFWNGHNFSTSMAKTLILVANEHLEVVLAKKSHLGGYDNIFNPINTNYFLKLMFSGIFFSKILFFLKFYKKTFRETNFSLKQLPGDHLLPKWRF